MATIPLDEIIPGATVRFTVIDGKQYLSIRDLIMHLCVKNQNDSGEVWRKLSEDKKNEVQDFILNFKFSGRGQSEQPVITFPGAIKLAMFLPGENAKKNRSIISQILVRYFAGDPSLIQEIEANAASEAPIAQMARASLASEEQEDNLISVGKKRQLEQMDFEERAAVVERMRVESREKQVELLAKSAELYVKFSSPQLNMDDRARLLFKDGLLNSVMAKSASPALAIEGGCPPGTTGFLTISTVANELGFKFDSSQIKRLGVQIAQAYFLKYREPPSKHEQFVDGAVRRVNSYQAKDRDLMILEMQRFAADNRVY